MWPDENCRQELANIPQNIQRLRCGWLEMLGGIRVSLEENYRKVLTSTSLYLQEGDYFSADEFMAADGSFDGDGRFCCSYKNPGNDEIKQLFNLAWHEVQTGVENSYEKVGA